MTADTNEFGNDWHVFQIRRALLTCPYLALSVPGFFSPTFRVNELNDAAASIIYVNMVSIFSHAVESRMSEQELERKNLKSLKPRLDLLNERNDLIDYKVLDQIRERRNEIAHELEKSVSTDELDEACSFVEMQLAAWGLVEIRPKYEIGLEKGSARASSVPGNSYEFDLKVRVMNGDKPVAEWVSIARVK